MMNLHVHTTWSDGENTPEEMILATIDAGLDMIGISDHSLTSFDTSYSYRMQDVCGYQKEIRELAKKYKDRIRVLCGIEEDYYADFPAQSFDYVIGSVHYVKAGTTFIPVDNDAAILRKAARDHYAGDIYKLIDAYYETLADVVQKTNADVIGHFDLIAKFNETDHLFDENDSRYQKAWRTAADALLKTGKVFEINFGAQNRGLRRSPYPSPEILEYLKKNGARFIITADAHAARHIAETAEKAKKLKKEETALWEKNANLFCGF